MTYKTEQYGKITSRRNYSKISGTLELPNLVEIQTESFEWFKKEGIEEVFKDIYPIRNSNIDRISLDYCGFHFEEPKYDVNECKDRDATYSAPLIATLRLNNHESGEINEQDVFMGDFPLMTPSGTFIINGAERTIVSQLVRSPGAYFKKEFENGKTTYLGSLIPSRGTWLEAETSAYKVKDDQGIIDEKSFINVRIDRTKKMPITVLLKALGLTKNEEIINLFGENELLNNTLDDKDDIDGIERGLIEVYCAIKPGDQEPTLEKALDLLHAIYFNVRIEALEELYKEELKKDDVDVMPLTQFVALVNAKTFKIYNEKRNRVVLNVLDNLTDELNNNLIRDNVEDLRDELHEIAKILKPGKTIKSENPITFLTSIYFEEGLAYHIANKTFEVSSQLAHEFAKLDLYFGRTLITELLNVTAEVEPELVGFQSIETLIKKIKVALALIEIYEKLKPGEPATLDGAINLLASKFFDPKRYDLTKAGRFKLGKKLSVLDRLLDLTLAEDIIDPETGEIVLEAGQKVTKTNYNKIRPVISKGANLVELATTNELYRTLSDEVPTTLVQMIKVYADEDHERIINIVGNNPLADEKFVTISDIFATMSYLLNITENIGSEDDIDHLGNRRVKSIGELIQNQFRIGLSRTERVVKDKMSTIDIDAATPKLLTNIRPLTAAIKEFFASSQLSQFMDQTNPLAELTHKRRLSALGPGGLARDRAGMEVRDVHFSHYGRMCPIETPEGPNIGLINSLSTYAKINEYGFITTPYRKVEIDEDGLYFINNDKVDYLTADEEYNYAIAQANIRLDENAYILDSTVVARFRGENKMEKRSSIDYVDVSPKQIVSVATSCIPFLENDDANRALMGANMQRQAIPLIKPRAPFVGTGMEHIIAKDSGTAVVCEGDGIVQYLDAKVIVVLEEEGRKIYRLQKYAISNQGTCFNQKPIVKVNERVSKGQVLADGPAMENAELALGQNVVVAFMTWNGYNYEDAIIMSERLVKDDVYTSIHIEEYTIESRDTKLGPEEITKDIPNISEEARKQLTSEGVIRIGAEVKEGDILVGKVTPKGHSELSAEEKLLLAIFGEKSREVKDNSLRVPHGGAGIVLDVKTFSRANKDELPPGVNEIVRVYIVQKRKISEGDKMAGRHGNKGVISRILPIEDMPHLPDGTPVDIMLNPLGVPSRMNIGQILEIHLGMAAKLLDLKVATPVFDGLNDADLKEIMEEANMNPDGKTILFDGKTGEKFEEPVTVGVMYMIKLAHMVDDKLHARSVGPYSLVTQQPLGGKALNGGQRFGEMEVWALEAYGAANTLQEILTVKSDDVIGRVKTYEAIVKGLAIPEPGIPESFRVLQKELQALAIDVKMLDENDQEIDMKEASRIDSEFNGSIRAINNDETELFETEEDDDLGMEEDFVFESHDNIEEVHESEIEEFND